MMIHLEGPIVDSFYDMFLISWSNHLRPTLPLLAQPPTYTQPPCYRFASNNPFLRNIDVVQSAQDARATLHREAETDRYASAAHHQDGILLSHVRDLMEERRRLRQQNDSHSIPQGQEAARKLELRSPSTRFSNAVQTLIEERRRSKNPSSTHPPGPIKKVPVQDPHPAPSMPSNSSNMDAIQTTTIIQESIRQASRPQPGDRDSSETSSPSIPNLNPLGPPDGSTHVIDLNSRHARLHSDTSTFKSVAIDRSPSRSPSFRFKHVKSRMRALSDTLNAGTLRQADANVSPDHDIGDFQPHTIHSEHVEFPIVMVNRPPHGFPGHNDIRVPQNAAWMAGFRYAQKKVFIQTPTLNASPVVKMCIETARRGVQVILYLDLGFNDKGESIPFQGGTNQQVVIKMYKALHKTHHQANLKVYWYTGKDQIRPINAVLKSRNCHVKFMAIDDSVGIQGNGNQDTQSWFHSQEINVMIDSPKIVQDWMSALISNQNTQLYGQVQLDGIWRDSDGHTVDYYDRPKLTAKLEKTLVEKKKISLVKRFSTASREMSQVKQQNRPAGTTPTSTTSAPISTGSPTAVITPPITHSQTTTASTRMVTSVPKQHDLSSTNVSPLVELSVDESVVASSSEEPPSPVLTSAPPPTRDDQPSLAR